MALMQCDVKSLEAVAAAYLSQDPIMMEELEAGLDMHSNNQLALKLPGWDEIGTGSDKAKFGRLIAKIFLFRILYGGSAYAFSLDPEFKDVGYNEKKWQETIDEFYRKYTVLAEWHKSIVKEVAETRKLTVPCTGRIYEFEPKNGKWPETQIKNFAVQGLGADIVALARVSLYNRWKKLKEQDKKWERCLLVNTVHDSLVMDYDHNLIATEELVSLIEGVFRDLPVNFERLFKVPFGLSVRVEIEVGDNWGNMKPV